jgi:uncharacterized protein YfaS (alpha-2-macroglobulin family)
MRILTLIICTFFVFTSISFSQKSKKRVHKRVKKVKVIPKPVVVPVAVAEKDIQQGICGSIFWKSGNYMPSPNRETPKAKSIQRELLVYELTNISEATLQDGFYTAIVKSKIKSIKSDAEGKFCLNLPEGDYSLFVKEGDKGLYANSFDGAGNIFPVKVNKDKVSIIVFTIDYQAVY